MLSMLFQQYLILEVFVYLFNIFLFVYLYSKIDIIKDIESIMSQKYYFLVFLIFQEQFDFDMFSFFKVLKLYNVNCGI